ASPGSTTPPSSLGAISSPGIEVTSSCFASSPTSEPVPSIGSPKLESSRASLFASVSASTRQPPLSGSTISPVSHSHEPSSQGRGCAASAARSSRDCSEPIVQASQKIAAQLVAPASAEAQKLQRFSAALASISRQDLLSVGALSKPMMESVVPHALT